MTGPPNPMGIRHDLLSGTMAGALSALGFTVVHDLLISDIWSSVGIMMVAGALCGLVIAWSFAVVSPRPSVTGGVVYNALLVCMLGLLGLASVLVFDPSVTFAEVLQSDGPPHDLFGEALPMTVAFTLAGSVALSLLFRRDWKGFVAVLLANTILITLLGMNGAVIGLVEIPNSALYVVVELFALIFSLGLLYALAYVGLERKRLAWKPRTGSPAVGPAQP